ncbi:MAG: hypothetical protein HEQ22_03300 [Sphingopyxis sp.]|uniref:hypothetical protein n=1 Tax=Sphingopyxis sp. TaxID=1908224 RepID=UPI003D80D985
MMADDTAWLPIAHCPNQTEVLVCNDCLLGWWAVAIQNALGEWEHASTSIGMRLRLKHEPTHFQQLPSIYPIALRRGRDSAQ